MKKIIALLLTFCSLSLSYAGTITIENNSGYKFGDAVLHIYSSASGGLIYGYPAPAFTIPTGVTVLNYTDPENLLVTATGSGSGYPYTASNAYLYELAMKNSDAPCGVGFMVRPTDPVFMGCGFQVKYIVSGPNKDVLIRID